MAVIDASVYIAVFNTHEPHHDACRLWLEATLRAEQRIWAPVLFLSEVSAAISRGLENPSLALQIVNRLRSSKIVQLAPVNVRLAARAAVIAAEYRIRGCDAIYVALAEQLKLPLITLDRQQLARACAVVTATLPTSFDNP